MAGSFPLSIRLGEERLARELDISRTPVREALARLHAEALLDRHPGGGYEPAVPDLSEIVELYEVRSVLENAAVMRPAHDLELLRPLEEDWQSLREDVGSISPDPGFVLVDEDFHIRLATAAGNHALAATLGGINERIRIVRMHDFLTSPRIEATIEQHLVIVRHLIEGDNVGAQRALNAHLAESEEVVQQRASAAIARMLVRRRDSK